MVDGITNIAWVPIVAARRVTTGTAAPSAAPNWDSRESPGPNSEAELSRPSTGRVLAVGALALVVSTPILDSVDPPTESVNTAIPAVAPAMAGPPPLLVARGQERASRSAARRTATRPAASALRAAQRSVEQQGTRILTVRRAEQSHRVLVSRFAAQRRAAAQRRVEARRRAEARSAARPTARTATRHGFQRAAGARVATRHRSARRGNPGRAARGMSAVVAYARSQVGKNYASGGEGPNSFDCSGFTKRAYAQAGLRLPHSSGAQAARARTISRSSARAGDLVVGPGHVGIYMGGGMMIDAGNPRTGVVYRRLYAGLHIERF